MDTEDLGKTTALDSDRTMIAQTPSAEATMLGESVTCPVCKTENAPGEKYCGDCGFLLSSTPADDAGEVEVSEHPRLADVTGQREFILHPGENTVGREGTDVLLSDATVSRRHALLVLEDDRAWVEDLGSTNGTFAAGNPVGQGERVELSDGAEVKFGSVVLSLRLPAPAETVDQVDEAEQIVVEDAIVAKEEDEAAFVDLVEDETIAEVEEVEEPVVETSPVGKLILTADSSIEHAVMPGTNTIGRRDANDIVLSGDPYVSGSHAEIVAEDGQFMLTDVGSTNGTVLNGSKLTPGQSMPLNPGDEVVLGRTALKFEASE